MRKLLLTIALLACIGAPGLAQKQGQALADSLIAETAGRSEDSNTVRLLDNISAIYSNFNPDEGLRWGQQSLAMAQKIGWRVGEGNAWNNIGNNYQAKGMNPQALEAFFKSLRVWEDLRHQEGICIATINIGIVYKMERQLDKAQQYYRRALSIAEAGGFRNHMRAALGNLGIMFMEDGQWQDALTYQKRALRIAEEEGNQGAIIIQIGNIGCTYQLMKAYPSALAYNFKALTMGKEIGGQYDATYLGNIGEIYVDIARDSLPPTSDSLILPNRAANLAQGVVYLRRAIAVARASSYLEVLPELCQYLSDALALQGDYRGALAAYQERVGVRDSLYNIESSMKIAALETQREVELKNKQIEIDRLAVAKKRNERGFFIVGIGLLLAVILVVFRNYRVQRVLNSALSVEKEKVERHTEELDATNKELTATLTELKETQEQLIVVEKQKENELIRSRISQDIHDDISSELTRISWVSELTKKKVAGAEYAAIPALLDRLTDSSRETVTKLGEIIWTVNPRNDTLASLLAYMRSHIAKFFADTAFTYTVSFPESGTDVHINPELKRSLYLVMKEALNNVAKYSGASKVSISMKLDGEAYTFCMADDGRGMEDGVVQGGGNGLGNMRRRMESVRGACAITSAPGQGTTVCCKGQIY